MKFYNRFRTPLWAGLLVVGAGLVSAPAAGAAHVSRKQLSQAAATAVAVGDVIGVQILVGRNGKVDFFESHGRRSPGGGKPVDDDTMFCIGSCSKPLSSVTLLRLADAGKLRLNQPIDTWLPAFAHRRLKGGGMVRRAPTLNELLCHRGGIYSQRLGLNPRQRKLLYEFDHTLEFAVDGMAEFPYLWEPGSRFAYSGAGYCVAGRVAEVALNQEFERIMQERLCQPLGMNRTTFFPGKIDTNIAVGAMWKDGRLIPMDKAPHLAQPHAMQLVGGSVYSTAKDLAKFARMIAREATGEDGRFLSSASWNEMTRVRGSNSYGLGWKVAQENERIAMLSHEGSLAQYRATLTVHLPTGSYLIVLTTLGASRTPSPKRSSSVTPLAKGYFQDFILRR